MKLDRRSVWVLVLASCLGAAACAGKVTKENYDKVATGMSPKEVEAILGPGTEQASSSVTVPTPSITMPAGMPGMSGMSAMPGMAGGAVSGKVMTWQSGGKMITVTFFNDKVAAKAQVGL